MTFTVNFIERHSADSPSIERVFRKVAECLNGRGIKTFFEKLPYGDGAANVVRNLREFKAHPADIYHVTGHATYITMTLPKERTVVTFHDLTLLSLRRGLRREILKRVYYSWPARRAARITAISDATAHDLAAVTRIDRSSIFVIGNPSLIQPPHSNSRFNATKPRILQIGTAPNKNVPNLLRALAGLDCIVHLVGPMTEEVERELHANETEFEHSPSLNDEGMIDAYTNADIVTLCSTIEGFGLPIVEAQAMGVPVVTSDVPPMSEVAGDGAVRVDPKDPASIRRGIESILSSDRLRSELAAAGQVNIRRFAPERIAGEYETIYRKILGAR